MIWCSAISIFVKQSTTGSQCKAVSFVMVHAKSVSNMKRWKLTKHLQRIIWCSTTSVFVCVNKALLKANEKIGAVQVQFLFVLTKHNLLFVIVHHSDRPSKGKERKTSYAKRGVSLPSATVIMTYYAPAGTRLTPLWRKTYRTQQCATAHNTIHLPLCRVLNGVAERALLRHLPHHGSRKAARTRLSVNSQL